MKKLSAEFIRILPLEESSIFSYKLDVTSGHWILWADSLLKIPPNFEVSTKYIKFIVTHWGYCLEIHIFIKGTSYYYQKRVGGTPLFHQRQRFSSDPWPGQCGKFASYTVRHRRLAQRLICSQHSPRDTKNDIVITTQLRHDWPRSVNTQFRIILEQFHITIFCDTDVGKEFTVQLWAGDACSLLMI